MLRASILLAGPVLGRFGRVTLPPPGGDVIGLDWRISLADGRRIVGERAVQGNLDPAVCLTPFEVIAAHARDVLDRAAGRPGHVFNLGHGVLPQTDPDNLRRLVDFVHEQTAAGVVVAGAHPGADA